jgi:hypothetical protein
VPLARTAVTAVHFGISAIFFRLDESFRMTPVRFCTTMLQKSLQGALMKRLIFGLLVTLVSVGGSLRAGEPA